jgi:hypothetical protein
MLFNNESSTFFCSNSHQQPLGAATSVKPTCHKGHRHTNRTPCIAQAKPVEINRTFVFHPFLETTPQAMANLACSRRN